MLGARLRELRQARGMSLRELAAAAEVSPAMLSQMERELIDPSLSTLRRLAKVFNSSMVTLFADPDHPRVAITRPGQRMQLRAPKGKVAYSRLTAGSGDLEVLEADLAPGDVSAEEPRGHASTECCYVLAGQVTVEVDGELYTVRKGEAITIDSRLPHRYRNDGKQRARMLLAVTPPNP